jgi:hypothetical protein
MIYFPQKYFQKLQNFHPSATCSRHATIATQSTTLCPQKHHREIPLSPKHPKNPSKNTKAPDESGAKFFPKLDVTYDAFFDLGAGAAASAAAASAA